jgi:hypothetical protein
MSDTTTDTPPARRMWRPEGQTTLTRRSPRINDDVWGIALRHAEAEGFTVSSYIRKVITMYLDQPKRVTVAETPGGKPRETLRPLRTSDALWDRVGSRALRDRTSREGVIAAAILYADAQTTDGE